MYFYHDVFDYIYNKGKHENLDIIGFLTVNLYNYNAEINYMKNTKIFSQIWFLPKIKKPSKK